MHLQELEETQSDGIYVGVRFSEDTLDKLVYYQEIHDIPNPTPREKLHTTILYSKQFVPWDAKTNLKIVVSPEHSKLTIFGHHEENALVWHYVSEYLSERFKLGMDMGATFDYDSYKPHITLSYDVGDFDYKSLPLPNFNIEILEEYTEPLEQDHS